jgi:hypothetical protein
MDQSCGFNELGRDVVVAMSPRLGGPGCGREWSCAYVRVRCSVVVQEIYDAARSKVSGTRTKLN